MAHFETSRVNDMLGLQIGTVQEAAQKLSTEGNIEELEWEIAALEDTISGLKERLESLPHKHRE